MIEYECTCNRCGRTWPYNEKHAQANKNRKTAGMLSAVAGALDSLQGNSISSYLWINSAQQQMQSVVDYGECPYCGSVDVSVQQRTIGPGGGDYASELVKYSRLFKDGAITQQEFDLLKQRLLGN